MAVSKCVTVTFPAIDWEEMRTQKLLLLQLAEKHPGLDGVISVYDEIQDQADAGGLPVQWLTDEEDE